MSSKFKGVCFHKRHKKWQASINSGGRLIHLGSFGGEIEAAKAYNEAALEYFGEFAKLNEVDK